MIEILNFRQQPLRQSLIIFLKGPKKHVPAVAVIHVGQFCIIFWGKIKSLFRSRSVFGKSAKFYFSRLINRI